MELFINYALYFIAGVCILVPLCGFGLAPPVIVKAALGIFIGNAYAQNLQQGLLRIFIKDNANNKLLKPVLPAVESFQTAMEELDNPALRQQRLKGEKKDEHHGSGHHIIPIPVYVGVLLVLLVGTIITVWVARYDFGAMNTVIAMLVAMIKASFVLAYFMHLKYDNMMNRVIFGSAFFFLMLLVFFSVADIWTRVHITKGF